MAKSLFIINLLFFSYLALNANGKPGEYIFIHGHWFLSLSKDENKRNQWAYHHAEDVYEVFHPINDKSELWQGDLGSIFDLKAKSFSQKFSAAVYLNLFLKTKKTQFANQLSLFIKLHSKDSTPYYLRPYLKKIKAKTNRQTINQILEKRKPHAPYLHNRLFQVKSLNREISLKKGPDEFYRQMFQNGTFDISIVGGNLQNRTTEHFASKFHIHKLKKKLITLGFKSYNYHPKSTHHYLIKQIHFKGKIIITRVQMTAGYLGLKKNRLGIANFVEGLAHADLLIYHGHSNRDTGAYYISEDKSRFSKFQLGFKSQKDILEKCHWGKTKMHHQILALQSCFSYYKYCLPIQNAFKNIEYKKAIGYIGSNQKLHFREFSPRNAKLIEMLLNKKGARDILQAINSIKPFKFTSNLIFRGVLQKRNTFILPKDISIVELKTLSKKYNNYQYGIGSDGRKYFSSENFAQNFLGEIVQIIALKNSLLGLSKQGILYSLNRRTQGALKEIIIKKHNSPIIFMANLISQDHNKVLCVIDRNYQIFSLSLLKGKLKKINSTLPNPERPICIGNTANNQILIKTMNNTIYKFDIDTKKYIKVSPSTEIKNITPHLEGFGLAGYLWFPKMK